MWRMTSRLVTTILTATVALAGLAALEAGAATVQSDLAVLQPYSYLTSGSIANGASGAPISFIGAASQSLNSSGTFALGQFDAHDILPSSATLTYNNTPFTVTLNVANPVGSSTPYYAYLFTGTLNGSINGSGGSSMVARLNSVVGLDNGLTTPPFAIANILYSIPQGINAPNASAGTDGLTTIYAQIVPSLPAPVPAPEPASIAIFGVGLVAWGIRRRMTPAQSA